MTVPARVEAAVLLLSLDPPEWFVAHSRAVAEVASWLAAHVEANRKPVDRALAESAALLHDVDKALPLDDPVRRLRHGDGSAAWLEQHGYPELAPVVASHPVTRLTDGAWFDRWIAESTIEQRIVAYADKRASQQHESMDDRFARWLGRNPSKWDDETARAVRARADVLESAVCAAAGVTPDQVAREPWTEDALREARTRP
jgi:putative nucleotidyltransferase with HDIG domain